MFLDDDARSVYVDCEGGARRVLAALHLYAGRWPNDPLLVELVDELSARSCEFDRWWTASDVGGQAQGSMQLRHPVVGDLTLAFETFTAADDPEQVLGIYTPSRGLPRNGRCSTWQCSPHALPQESGTREAS